jgi:tRNA (mo5U34)-methyltransferase
LTGLDVEAREIDVPDITPETVGMFDVVLFSGVFYHLIDPIHLTRQISTCARHALVLETHQDGFGAARPAMIFYPGTTLAGDPTNWWGPNPPCVYELLKEFGFAEILYRDAPHAPPMNRGSYQAFRNKASMAAMGVADIKAPWISLSDPNNRKTLFAPR